MTQARLRVAVGQIMSRIGDLSANVESHRTMIAEARKARVDLLLFPELSLTGYNTGSKAVDLAIVQNDDILLDLADAAGDTDVVVGFIEEGLAAQLYNSAALLSHGDVWFVHRKINLPNYGTLDEGKRFASGRYVEASMLEPPWRASILIGVDLWNPALVHLTALHGASLLLAPITTSAALNGDADASGWTLATRFYAMIYGLPMLVANRVGRDGDVDYSGGSRILGPRGEVMAAAGSAEPELIVADIDFAEVRRARFDLPTVRDSNLDLIHREIERLQPIIGIPDVSRRL